MFRVAGHFFFYSWRAQTWFQLSRVKIIQKWWLGVRGRFDLSRTQVTEGQITVNVWIRNPGEMHYGSSKRGFESSRVNCVRYLWHCNIPQNTALHYITSSAPFLKHLLSRGLGLPPQIPYHLVPSYLSRCQLNSFYDWGLCIQGHLLPSRQKTGESLTRKTNMKQF